MSTRSLTEEHIHQTAAKHWWTRLAEHVFGGKSSEPVATKGRRSRPQPFRSRLLLEPLEDRLAPAVTYTWTGASLNNPYHEWSDANNWDPQGVPTTTDDVFFKAGNNVECNVDVNSGGTVHDLTIEQG